MTYKCIILNSVMINVRERLKRALVILARLRIDHNGSRIIFIYNKLCSVKIAWFYFIPIPPIKYSFDGHVISSVDVALSLFHHNHRRCHDFLILFLITHTLPTYVSRLSTCKCTYTRGLCALRIVYIYT
jgi:hypothetical protein